MYYLELEQIQILTTENGRKIFWNLVDIFFPPHFMQILNQCGVSTGNCQKRIVEAKIPLSEEEVDYDSLENLQDASELYERQVQ